MLKNERYRILHQCECGKAYAVYDHAAKCCQPLITIIAVCLVCGRKITNLMDADNHVCDNGDKEVGYAS